MSNKKMFLLFALLIAAAFVLVACAGPAGTAGPAGPAGAAGAAGPAGPAATTADLTCTECHNNTTLLVSKRAQFNLSGHGMGDAYERGTSASCAGCHGTEGPEARIKAGLAPHDASIEGVVNVSPINCRMCHNIHSTYTYDDFSLIGDEQPVVFEKTGGTFDGGAGNLCANCHQIRNDLPVVTAGMVEVESRGFGTHHGVESQMLLGEGGLGVSGKPSAHYSMVEETCVGCHMGEGEFNHTYEPNVARCQSCHADLDDFDNNGVQTEVKAMLEELHSLFIDKKIIDPESDRYGIYDKETDTWSRPSADVPMIVTEAVANAMWNYSFVIEDQSMGVHNSAYTKALLQQALDDLKALE